MQRHRVQALVATLVCVFGLAACKKKAIPPIPVDCEPLDATNSATPPAMNSDGTYPQTINIVSGDDTAGGYYFADAQGFVNAPIADVWVALQDPQVVADRRELQSETIVKMDVDPNSGWSYLLQSVTSAANLGFPYETEWRGSPTAGTEALPTTGHVCGNLTQSGMVAGTAVMNILQDSIVIVQVAPNTTSYAAIRHRGDDFSSAMVCQQYLQDVFNSLVAKVNNMPLPTY